MPRDTGTGGVLENMILPAMSRGGYTCQAQVHIGTRLGGRKHKVDAVAEKGGSKILVSLKWQQTGGTAEQKVPFEIICLAQAVNESAGEFLKAYLVLGGEGWTLRDLFTSGGLDDYLTRVEGVRVVTLEKFIALANRGEL